MVLDRIRRGGAYDPEVSRTKRRAEAANSAVFSSLQRMGGDPKNRQDRLEAAAALANGNQRLTRALNLMALELGAAGPLDAPALAEFAALADAALAALAAALAAEAADPAPLARARAALDRLKLPQFEDRAAEPRQTWAFAQLARAGTELGAMLVAAEERTPEPG